MFDKADIFSDAFAQNGNFATRIEARTKMGFVVLALIINLLSPGVATPLALAAFCLITLLLVRVPARLLLLRLAMPLAMAIVVLVTQVFFFGQTPLFALPLWRFTLVGYEEGLAHGFLIMCRVLAGVSLVLLLSMTTPADRLFRAAAWFRMPQTFMEIGLLVYRYIFVLAEELVSMKDAQKLRLGYHSWRQSMKSWNTLAASLFLRAYDRAERVFEAMLVRGYAGPKLTYGQTFTGKDGTVALCLGLILAGFYLIGRAVT